ncbi:hypothetical protein BVC80_1835g729 [Macleaya cordata]|uniref:Uncharacterized protein n=1 Tax=Macleaya cordata TaxID=56857 RepID=A0A200R6I9_MACCD|nr:hypothetical protein BVC80_1835g729 [Macleaya cordata]
MLIAENDLHKRSRLASQTRQLGPVKPLRNRLAVVPKRFKREKAWWGHGGGDTV